MFKIMIIVIVIAIIDTVIIVIVIIIINICQRGEYHSTRALIGSSDAGYPVLSTSGRSSLTARAIRLIFEQFSLF